MSSRGRQETERLRKNITDQYNRLLQQLSDLEEFKFEFSTSEYNELKSETTATLKEFAIFLEKSLKGDMTLIDEFNAMQLAIQAAISQAFKTPLVISMFASKQPAALRAHLNAMQTELKLKHISQSQYDSQAYEILLALKKLNEKLSPSEETLLENSLGMTFENVGNDNISRNVKNNLLNAASSEIHRGSFLVDEQ